MFIWFFDCLLLFGCAIFCRRGRCCSVFRVCSSSSSRAQNICLMIIIWLVNFVPIAFLGYYCNGVGFGLSSLHLQNSVVDFL